MKRAKSRFLSLLLMTCLVISMVPVGPASGALLGGPAVQSAGSSRVQADAGKGFVSIEVEDMNGGTYDVYRAASALDTGVMINENPVSGQRFVDHDVVAGASYCYTIKSGDEVIGLALVSVPLPKVKREAERKDAPAGKEAPVAAAATPIEPTVLSEDVLAGLATVESSTGVTFINANTTWSGSVFVRNDVVVAAGKTLTVAPGTTVYFDTAASGEADADDYMSLDATSVTSQIDLIVHGKLIANGTASSRIYFTSIQSLPESASVGFLPASGDWGCIFTDSRSASSISYAQIEFAKYAVWAQGTSYPTVKNCVMRDVYDDGAGFPWAAVCFVAPPTPSLAVPRVTITGNTMMLEDRFSEGIMVYALDNGKTTADRVVDPYIANNTINASYPLDLESTDEISEAGTITANVRIRGTVTGNTFFSPDCDAVYVYADLDASRTVEFTTAFSNNTLRANDDDAVYVGLYTGGDGSAIATPKFTGDKITSSGGDGVYMWIESADSTTTAKAVVKANPTFTSCDIRSAGGDGVYMYAGGSGWDSAENVAASVNPVFTGGSIQSSSDDGVDLNASGENAGASASPIFTNVTGRAMDSDDFLCCIAYDYGTGLAKASPKWVGGSISASAGDGIYACAESDRGPAESKVWLESSKILADDYGIYSEAYACDEDTGTGNADVRGTVLKSTIIAQDDDAYHCYADASSNSHAYASPTIKNSTLDSNVESALEAEAYSDGGSANCSPIVMDSVLSGYDAAFYPYAYRYGATDTTSSVVMSPQITRSKLTGTYSEAAYLYASNQGEGDAICKPVFDSSTFWSSYYSGDEAAYLYAYALDDKAEIAPAVKYCTFNGAGGGYEAYARSDGRDAVNSGSFLSSSFRGTWDDALYVYGEGGAGNIVASPQFTKCTFLTEDFDNYDSSDHSEDWGALVEATTFDTGVKSVTVSPVFSGGSVVADCGVKIHSRIEAAATQATSTASPQILNMPVTTAYTSDTFAISVMANHEGTGRVDNGSYIYNCPITGGSGGIQLHANAGEGSTFVDCYNTARVHGVSSASPMKVDAADAGGVRSLAVSWGGNAYNRSEFKNLAINSHGHGIFTRAYTKSTTVANKVAKNESRVIGNRMGALWGSCDSDPDGIHATASAACTSSVNTNSSYIVGNSIVGAHEDGIEVSACDEGSDLGYINATISGNSIYGVRENGLYIWDAFGTTMTAPTITKNTIVRPGWNGIYMDVAGGMVSQNKVLQPGAMYPSDEGWTACVRWDDAVSANSLVKGNLLVGSASTGVYYNDDEPVTQYNSFTDAAGNLNRPFNYWTSTNTTEVATSGMYATTADARFNWWGVGTADVSRTVTAPSYGGPKSDIVDYSSPLLTRQPKVTKIVVSKTSTKVKFTVTFDRPMDTAVKKLYFGKSSPYKTYNATGTWNTAGTVWTATRSKAGLPTGVKLYFTGALDLPGNTMLSTSKYFKL